MTNINLYWRPTESPIYDQRRFKPILKSIMKRSTIITLLLLLVGTLAAQELTVQAPSRVEVGRRFEVRYQVNAHASDFRGPNFKGLSVLAGPMSSSSSSISIINGQRSSSVTTGYTYIIMPDQEGTFSIGGASCMVDGKKLTTPGFTIKVEKGSGNAQAANNGNSRGQRQQGNYRDNQASEPSSQSIDGNTLFARASVNKKNPYQGEQIILTYKIYTQVSLQQFQIDKLPGNKGFWAEDLSEGKQVKQYEETIDGRRYSVAEIRRGALFAQESGKLTIEPLDLNVLAMVQRRRQRTGTIWDFFDDPFFNSAQAVEKPLRTNSLAINVRPLPASPQGFNGAVGSFNVKHQANTHEVKANEAITYSITVSGNGNLMLINAPEIEFPKIFEVYDPQVTDHINRSSNGISGSRTFEWVLIPRTQGSYQIPALSFVYFDPASGKYITKTAEAISVKVNKGDPNAMQSVTNKNDVKLLNNDINYISTNTSLSPIHKSGTIAWWFIALAVIILACIPGIIYISNKSQHQDIAATRLKRATREARKRLKKAALHLADGNDNTFYEEIYKAIWGCLADKYNIELARLSSDTVRQCLVEKQVSEEKQTLIMRTLTDVDFARFAPGDAAAKKQQIYNEALEMIAAL